MFGKSLPPLQKAIWLTFFSALESALLINCGGTAQQKEDVSYLSDTTLIAQGKEQFDMLCISCHAFRGDGSGPALGGITKEVSPAWVASFIANPQELIVSGDARAVAVDQEFPAVMPSFGYLEENDLKALVAFIHSKRGITQPDQSGLEPGITNPIPEPIPLSDIVVDIEEVWQTPATAEKRPLARINKMVPDPTGQLFLLDLNGVMYQVADGQLSVYLDMRAERPHFVSRPGLGTGFGSFAFHPEFESNGKLYTTHTEPGGQEPADFVLPDSLRALQWILSEWQTDDPSAVPFRGTSRELMRLDYTGTIHGVQNIAFNSTATKGDRDYGLLYMGAGDGRAALNGYPEVIEGIQSVWGALLRIDPSGSNSANGQYGIPADNPFVGTPGAVGEIYAHGFRNPHLFTWREDGAMLLTNIGERNLESIYVIEKGADYGWPRREGNLAILFEGENSQVYPLPADDSGYSYPAAQFDHDEAGAICGGYIYDGHMAPLQRKYIFGSIVSGRLFFVDAQELKPNSSAPVEEFRVRLNGQVGTLRDHLGTGRIDLRFGLDAEGTLYIMTKLDGRVYRVVGLAS